MVLRIARCASLAARSLQPSTTFQCTSPIARTPTVFRALASPPQKRAFSQSSPLQATLMQVLRGCRQSQKARRKKSPQLAFRPEMKGVCMRIGITKPKKPNSGERKTARVRLSNGKEITAYIPGEGHNVQQHSVVMVRGGRSQDCPGVKYKLVRGALDLVSS